MSVMATTLFCNSDNDPLVSGSVEVAGSLAVTDPLPLGSLVLVGCLYSDLPATGDAHNAFGGGDVYADLPLMLLVAVDVSPLLPGVSIMIVSPLGKTAWSIRVHPSSIFSLLPS